jgi:hypothetical protein
LPLDQLAKELHVHLRTLQAAARTGRLEAHFSVRSAFGRPIRRASRAAGTVHGEALSVFQRTGRVPSPLTIRSG